MQCSTIDINSTQHLKYLHSFIPELNNAFFSFLNDLEKSFGKQIQENNAKFSYFLIDMIKLMIPNCQKPEEKIAHAISNRFNNHQLGSLSSGGKRGEF